MIDGVYGGTYVRLANTAKRRHKGTPRRKENSCLNPPRGRKIRTHTGGENALGARTTILTLVFCGGTLCFEQGTGGSMHMTL